MLGEIGFLFLSLVMILFAAETFTNGIEGLGKKFALSQAVVGSLLAAVGTALPETILPIVAIFLYGGASANEIGVGAILGAPFMLSTLAFFLVGLTAVVSSAVKRRPFGISVEVTSTKRDLMFFLPMYGAAIIVPLVSGRRFAPVIALFLVAGYIFYAYRTFRCESACIEHSEGMYLWRVLRHAGIYAAPHPGILVICIQVLGALGLMILGAHSFVKNLEHISVQWGMDPLLFALILAPIATELPEKFNSVTWTWKGRDTLAIGNITGAMVFQSTFPVAVGLLSTDWKLSGMGLFSAVIALISTSVVLGQIVVRKRLSPITLLFGGGLYLVYAFALVINRG